MEKILPLADEFNVRMFDNSIVEECARLNDNVRAALAAKRDFLDECVRWFKPSWFKKPCFVKVHYKELDYPHTEDGGRSTKREWIDKVSGEMYLAGFEVSEICKTHIGGMWTMDQLSFDVYPVPEVEYTCFVPVLYLSKPIYNTDGTLSERAGNRVTMFDGRYNERIRITGFEIVNI